MRIRLLGWELPPQNSGGLGVACYHMARALASNGAQIEFMVPYTADHTDIDFMKVISTSKLSPLSVHAGAYDGRCLTCTDQSSCNHEPASGIRSLQKHYKKSVEKHLENGTPDAIHAHDWLTFEAGVHAKELTGRPLIAHIHATEYDRAGGASGNPIIHEIEQHGLLMADRIIAVSGATKRLIVEKYGIPADKIEVVHNSINPADFKDRGYKPDDYRYIELLKNEGYTIVATLGRLTIQKGLRQFLEAASMANERFDKFVFLIAGDGEQRDELIQASADLGIADKVLFTGFVRGKQWRDVYELADVFVMSSVSEPFGLTALEAIAHDAAVVLTKQSGVGEIITHAFKYDYWDTRKLADILVSLASERSLVDTMTTHAREQFNTMSWDKVAERCNRQYELAGATV
jgi:glycosyltransferase involved in cell wall biosynthesis